jgi:hypothetical protein
MASFDHEALDGHGEKKIAKSIWLLVSGYSMLREKGHKYYCKEEER